MPEDFCVTAQIDFAQPLQGAHGPRLEHQFGAPLQVLQADEPAQLPALLEQVEQAARSGLWCVGGLRYEAAGALQPGLQTQAARGALAWFAIHAAPLAAPVAQPRQPLPQIRWHAPLAYENFAQHMQAIQCAIAAGAYYQVNYTQRLSGQMQQPVHGPSLFAALQRSQPGGYALYLDMGQEQLASVSPELFFDWHQPAAGHGRILTRPMKGTALRGATPQADAAQARHLQTSPKERAENVMIVDLLRNDLGRLAVTGSVQVPQLLQVQALPSVWQMTSDVKAQMPSGTSLRQLLQALFPCGSVTGAPKRAAMQAIAQLEHAPRGWYCGALGVVYSDGAGGLRATFNVPIRTVVIQGQQLQCGIGSGITADATVDGEWREWRAKRAFVERISMDFAIVETLALIDGQFRHDRLHVQRMAAAAAHFGFPWNSQAAHAALQGAAAACPAGLWRVRLQLDASGRFSHQAQQLSPTPEPVTLQLAAGPLAEAHSEFVRFKTTRRGHYERWAPRDPQVFDTVLWNEDGEITEATRGNIAALIDGRWVTPPLSCGLLNGVGRQVALHAGRMQEGIIRVADIPRVQQWAFINSLRGWLDARLC